MENSELLSARSYSVNIVNIVNILFYACAYSLSFRARILFNFKFIFFVMVPKSNLNSNRRSFINKDSLYPQVTSEYKPLSSYLRGAVDMDSTETRANGSPKYDVMPSSSEFGVNNIDPFADPRNSIFDIVAECSDPESVESIRQSLAGDASIVESDPETE